MHRAGQRAADDVGDTQRIESGRHLPGDGQRFRVDHESVPWGRSPVSANAP